MLQIRPEQLEVLTESAFEGVLVDHLHEFFPEECAELGAGPVRALVRAAVTRARTHGLDDGAHICLFVDLVFLFDLDFDTLPWAAEILGDASLAGQRDVQMLRLKEAALERLDAGEPDAE